MTWYLNGDISPLLGVSPAYTVCVDLETTGLDPRCDEILQIAIVSGEGRTLLNELVRPEKKTSWEAAQRVTGISPETVKSRPPFRDFAPSVQKIIHRSKLVVGYNLPFDAKFLRAAGIDVSRCLMFDVMREFAPVANRRTASGAYRWQSLEACAQHYGVSYSPHDALEDAAATMRCFYAMIGLLPSEGCRESSGEKSEGPCRTYLDVVAAHRL